MRAREHLTPGEVEKLIAAAGDNRHGHRDACMLLVCYRHGLRVAELIGLRWEQVDFNAARLHVRRVKRGLDATHPLQGDTLRALRRLHREQKDSPFVFTSERGAPFTVSGVAALVARAGRAAGLPFKAHVHQLRHACGFYLANKGIDTRHIQAYLGHSAISSTAIYTQLSDAPFRHFFSK
jgi:type 1 fimbriae regulatory protein FimB/type 1 fimbriae regulatory protein FimE